MSKRITAYLAPRGFSDELVHELGGKRAGLTVRDRLVIKPGAPEHPAWAQNIWLNPRFLSLSSIDDGVRQLLAMRQHWFLHSVGNHREAELIRDRLPRFRNRRIPFGAATPEASPGAWTLWEPGTILASPECSSPFPNGEVHFQEDRENPPNRAYLKLWEAFTLLGVRPQPGELCLDLGSCPGGWSWVVGELGARVFSIDKAPLDPAIDRHPNVQYCQGSGFAPDPRHMGRIDWLFSDMACYPERLYTLVTRWIEIGECRNFLCTVKLQGKPDPDLLARFKAIPDSRLLHLSCNKHELTWVRLENGNFPDWMPVQA